MGKLMLVDKENIQHIKRHGGEAIKRIMGTRKDKVKCPFHNDKNPSMVIGNAGFKCFGCGANGDVIDFVQRMYDIDFKSALSELMSERGMLHQQITPMNNVDNAAAESDPAKKFKQFRYRSREWNHDDYTYWFDHGISPETLEDFRVIPLSELWIGNKEDGFYINYDHSANNPGYLYDLGEGYYKGYFPFSSKQKFITNCPGHLWQGSFDFSQNHVVITSSRKDAMLLYELGYHAIAPQSENTIPELNPIEEFDRVLVFFDNGPDEIESARSLSDEVGCFYTYIPLDYQVKDPTDFHQAYGFEETLDVMRELIEIHLNIENYDR